MKNKGTKLLKDFINGSNSFGSFTFQGCYDMPREHFLKMFDHFVKTGENHLDEYSKMKWACWGERDQSLGFEYIDEDKRTIFKKWLNGESFWNFSTFASKERLGEIKRNISMSEDFDEERSTYKFRRYEACRHTNNKNIRKQVFDAHGEICSKCGSVENIQIDHIVPVAKMGPNTIENYIPLCRSCNASKGSR